MKWVNHIAIGGATCAVVTPSLVPVAVLGSTAPDWLEGLAQYIGRPVRHRGPTHWLLAWVLAFVFALTVWDWHGLLAAFTWGGLSHVIADALTVSGVPLWPLSNHRIHFFGGRFRTSSPGEYVFAWGLVLLCWLLSTQVRTSGYSPFFPDWPGYYAKGIATAKEWRENRFRFF